MAADLRNAEAAVHTQPADIETEVARPVSRWRMALLGVLLLAAAGLALWHWQDPVRQAWEGRFGKPPEPVFAVVAFYVPPTDAPRPYYGAGFAEELARRLAKVRGVTVLGRSSVRASTGKPPQSAAAAVGAKLVLAGTLKPKDDEWTSFDVETRLVDARDGRVLWTRSYTSAAQGPARAAGRHRAGRVRAAANRRPAGGGVQPRRASPRRSVRLRQVPAGAGGARHVRRQPGRSAVRGCGRRRPEPDRGADRPGRSALRDVGIRRSRAVRQRAREGEAGSRGGLRNGP